MKFLTILLLFLFTKLLVKNLIYLCSYWFAWEMCLLGSQASCGVMSKLSFFLQSQRQLLRGLETPRGGGTPNLPSGPMLMLKALHITGSQGT